MLTENEMKQAIIYMNEINTQLEEIEFYLIEKNAELYLDKISHCKDAAIIYWDKVMEILEQETHNDE